MSQSEGVRIGNVSGGISNSVIAGRDVKDMTITIGGELIQADKQPSVAELSGLLRDVWEALSVVSEEQEALDTISTGSRYKMMAARENVKQTIEAMSGESPEGQVEVTQKRITEATEFVSSVITDAKQSVDKAGALGASISSLIEKVSPLVDKLGVAGALGVETLDQLILDRRIVQLHATKRE